MSPGFQQRLLATAPFDAADQRALLNTARALKRAQQGGAAAAPLRGKNIAIVCADPHCPCVESFNHAAQALGARVSRLAPEAHWLHSERPTSPDESRLLGRLYDAIGCEEVPPGFAQRLHQQLGVPVYQGLAHGDPRLDALAAQLSDSDAPAAEDNRRLMLQAVLVETMV